MRLIGKLDYDEKLETFKTQSDVGRVFRKTEYVWDECQQLVDGIVLENIKW